MTKTKEKKSIEGVDFIKLEPLTALLIHNLVEESKSKRATIEAQTVWTESDAMNMLYSYIVKEGNRFTLPTESAEKLAGDKRIPDGTKLNIFRYLGAKKIREWNG